MTIRLKKLLQDPELGIELVAGAKGVDRRGPIRWIHCTEMRDPTPWLHGHEIVLSTGFGIKESKKCRRDFVIKLDELRSVALGIGIGGWTPEVPDEMKEEAERRSLPLFTVPYTVSFSTITQKVANWIFDDHYHSLKNSVDIYRQTLSLVLAGKNAQTIMDMMLRNAMEARCVLYDFYGEVIAATRCSEYEIANLWEVARGQMKHDRWHNHVDGQFVMGSTLRYGRDVEALLVLSTSREPGESGILRFEQLLVGIQLTLARRWSLRSARRTAVSELIEDAMEGAVAPKTLRVRLQRLGLDPDGLYTVFCTQGIPRVTLDAVCGHMEDLVGNGGLTPVVGMYQEHVFCIAPGTAEIAHDIVQAGRDRGWITFAVGRSQPRSDLSNLHTSIREAMIALASDSDSAPVRDVGSTGLLGALSSFESSGWSKVFVEQVLGRLARQQFDRESQLLETLRVYIHNGCRSGVTAKQLGIHRHTVAQRLNRISELTGRDVHTGRGILELALAIELHDLSD